MARSGAMDSLAQAQRSGMRLGARHLGPVNTEEEKTQQGPALAGVAAGLGAVPPRRGCQFHSARSARAQAAGQACRGPPSDGALSQQCSRSSLPRQYQSRTTSNTHRRSAPGGWLDHLLQSRAHAPVPRGLSPTRHCTEKRHGACRVGLPPSWPVLRKQRPESYFDQ